MKKKMQLYRKIIATLHDGKEIRVSVYKAGRAVELRFFHPNNGLPISILVHPLHVNTPEGWMYEIGVQCGLSISVVRWRWED